MKVGFIINDLDSMDLKKDTSVYLMKEAFDRDYEVRIFDVCDVTYKDNDLYADSSKVHLIILIILNFLYKILKILESKNLITLLTG